MSYYRKPPVLDADQQAEFDKYLVEQYQQDIELAIKIVQATSEKVTKMSSFMDEATIQDMAFRTILDKLATPRIYLLQAWLHRQSQIKAGILSETGDAAEAEKK